MTLRNFTNTATTATLTSSIAAPDTGATLTSFSSYPSPPFTAVLDRGTASEEVVLVTAVSGATVTMTRGYDGTTAKSHAAGASFQHAVVAKDLAEANAHVNAVTGVHGVTSGLVGLTDVQTLTNKTLTAPTLTAPTITGTLALSAANITTLTVSGVTTLANASVTGTLTVPTPTATGHAAPKSYVDGINTALAGRLTPLESYKIKSGTTTITPSAANTPTSKPINFGVTFANTPNVVVTIGSSVPGTTVTGVGVTNVTTTGATIWLTRVNTTDTGVYWIATDA